MSFNIFLSSTSARRGDLRGYWVVERSAEDMRMYLKTFLRTASRKPRRARQAKMRNQNSIRAGRNGSHSHCNCRSCAYAGEF